MITATKAQNWMTPRPVFNGLHADYRFTRDGAASLSNHLLPRYWTALHNTLVQEPDDDERIFINPPFGLIYEFLAWGYALRARCFTLFLLPANIETDWYHDFAVHGDKHVFKRRVAYVAPPSVIRAWKLENIKRIAQGKKPKQQSAPSFASLTVMFGPGVRSSGFGFSAARDGHTGSLIKVHPVPGILHAA